MSDTCFFDTYAFIEVIRGNPNYKKVESESIITTVFNMAELNYILKKEMSAEKADRYMYMYQFCVVEVTIDDIKLAMDIKTKHRNLSIPDAIGYVVARKYGVKFITGDSDFEGFIDAEIIK